VLQVAVVCDRPARAMKEVVHDAAESAAHIGAEHVHRFCRIVQARPGYGRGLVGDHHLVEGLVTLPQRFPVGTLVRADGPDHDIGGGHAPTPTGLQRSSAAAALIRNSCGIVSAGRGPKPHSVAIETFFTYFSALATWRRVPDDAEGVMHQRE